MESSSEIVLKVSFTWLVNHLPHRLLKELARAHRVSLGRAQRSLPGMVCGLRGHCCDISCQDVYTLCSVTVTAKQTTYSAVNAGWLRQFRCVAGTLPSSDNTELVYSGLRHAGGMADVEGSRGCVAMVVPLRSLLVELRREDFVRILAQHGVAVREEICTPELLVKAVVAHRCIPGQCDSLVTIFRDKDCHEPLPSLAVPSSAGSETQRIASSSFPPRVPSKVDLAHFVSDWCDAFSPASVAESICGVCGRITALAELTSVPESSLDLTPLVRSGAGVTRLERLSADDPVCEYDGPILDERGRFMQSEMAFLRVCQHCLPALTSGSLPRHALANGLWVGDVPPELKELNFVERLLVVQERHNACTVRVSKVGHRRMRANAVIFPQPVRKFYSMLPPPREDIEECLSILFVGTCLPTEKDFQRTPFIVRRDVVLRALKWLILNHPDYRDVGIAYDHLEQYPADGPPVRIVRRDPEEGEELVDAEAQPAFMSQGSELGTGLGTESCAFAVHGLTSSQYVSMTYEERVALAIQEFSKGNPVLAYGHSSTPSSMYDNPQLYPRMFPWLYPYGLGGFGNPRIAKKISRIEHVRHCLLYSDRRFQRDDYFPFIAFNHEQILKSTKGGYLLAERRNFDSVAERILKVDQDALQRLIDRGKAGLGLSPEGPEEKSCVELLNLVDVVAKHVPGSATERKYLRNEIRSLIIARNVPLFFITFSPVDSKHPLCLYYCGEPIDILDPEIDSPSHITRLRTISENPVGCAKFFNHVVKSFIRTILRADPDTAGDGLFGPVSSYYGTVEEQGRKTLHLHLLLWLEGSLSPQTIRDRLLAEEGFRADLIGWLESCHKGEYSLSTAEKVGERIANARGRDLDEEVFHDVDRIFDVDYGNYRDPATVLPAAPDPRVFKTDEHLEDWYRTMCETTDEIVYLSNRHDYKHRKGCLRGKTQYCKARFPREVRATTEIDLESGALRMRKLDPWLNTYNVTLSYLLRCNSDVTSLLSGTSVRAVIGYVTDYVTKVQLKTYSVFQAVKAVLDKIHDIEATSSGTGQTARRMLTKVVNALTAMREMGGPSVCSYLLGYPDHYTNEVFKVFFWNVYVRTALSDIPLPATAESQVNEQYSERVMLTKEGDTVVPMSKVNDYIFRPTHFESWSLYDYLRAVDVKKVRSKGKAQHDESDSDNDVEEDMVQDDTPAEVQCSRLSDSVFEFQPGHPQQRTHRVHLRAKSKWYILNFVGGTLPRRDRGDIESYCSTMLVLFAPQGWRTGRSLLGDCASWEDAFHAAAFTEEHLQVMRNMNVLYECLDARDDFSAMRRAEESLAGHSADTGGVTFSDLVDEAGNYMGDSDNPAYIDTERSLLDELDDPLHGTPSEVVRKLAEMRAMQDLLVRLGYDTRGELGAENVLQTRVSETLPVLTPNEWKERLNAAKSAVLEQRKAHAHGMPEHTALAEDGDPRKGSDAKHARGRSWDEVFITTKQSLESASSTDTSGDSVDRPWQDPHIELVTDTVEKFSLNPEQQLAFTIVAYAIHHHVQEPLRMYLAGMAGTGKSQVLRGLTWFMQRRNESYRLMILAPTGSSACNIDGSTYHSVLCFGREVEDVGGMDATKLEKLRGNLANVDVLFTDEISMVSCLSFYLICAYLSAAFGDTTKSFGGKHVIVAGDFGQLPPPGKGHYPLYSDSVGRWSKKLSHTAQMNVIGQAVWQQFTTVVVLWRNMRQAGLSEEDRRYRRALENARVKACDDDDIALLRSRIVGLNSSSPSLFGRGGQVASIITANNSHRDAINKLGSQTFAANHGLVLHYFHSLDSWGADQKASSTRATQRMYQSTVNPVRKTNRIGYDMQKILWSIEPCMTEHLAGVLPLCKGMPVLLKNNEATELCATNGAEGTVYDWVAHSLPSGEEVLDTLFVELTAPPKNVQVPGLPPNVIPIGRTKTRITCKLPLAGRSNVKINREQVMVLPNFAMTDFSSQGRTRPENPCHLMFCRTAQSIYTCLSRSSSLSGLVILEGFDESKLRGGLPRALKRELQSFEILAEITKLKAAGSLPANIHTSDRASAITSFRAWKGLAYVPERTHPALSWADDPNSFDPMPSRGVDWRMVTTAKTRKKVNNGTKRKRNGEFVSPEVLTKRARIVNNQQDATRDSVSLPESQSELGIGFQWDALDYSCAYDSLFTVLLNIGIDHDVLNEYYDETPMSVYLQALLDGFSDIRQKTTIPEVVRNRVRDMLFAVDPDTFPRRGAVLTAVTEIFITLFTSEVPYAERCLRCSTCSLHWAEPHVRSRCPYYCISSDGTDRLALAGILRPTVADYLQDFHAINSEFICCGVPVEAYLVYTNPPPVIMVEVTAAIHEVGISASISIRTSLENPAQRSTWSLRGVIYLGWGHFTSRYVASDGKVWFHDGASTGRACTADSPRTLIDFSSAGGRRFSHLIYVLDSGENHQ